jgi:hypothetical protein
MIFSNCSANISTQTEQNTEDFEKQVKKLLNDQKQSYRNEIKNLNLKSKSDHETIAEKDKEIADLKI